MSGSGESGTITIAVRVRPFSQKEIDSKDNYSVIDCPEFGKIRCSKKGLLPTIFSFDHTFCHFDEDVIGSGRDSQQEIYEALGLPLLNKVLAGYNACLLAYGVTTSGKTYSMYGTADEPGIIPRIAEDLFARIDAGMGGNVSTTVHFTYYEIYNEKINDLLQNRRNPPQLTVREHPVTGPFVEGLIQPLIHSSEEMFSWLRQGDARRSVASTEMNACSSRSHTVACFIIRRELVKLTEEGTIEKVYTSKLTLVDLAGSERQSSANGMSERLMETCQINKSLFVLGRVISQLSGDTQSKIVFRSTERLERKRPKLEFEESSQLLTPQTLAKRKANAFVSYRDSLLTWILKDSLGGNSVTTMLATVSPSSLHIDDTLSTLRYAKRAQCIVNKAVVNEDIERRIIRELMLEVEKLRRRLNESKQPNSPPTCQVRALKRLLPSREEEVAHLTDELTKRTTVCTRLQPSLVPLPSVDATPQCLHAYALNTNESCGVPMRHLKSNLCPDRRVAPDGAEKSEFDIQTGRSHCEGNFKSSKNLTAELLATVNETVGPSEITMKKDASTNTKEDITVIPLTNLHKMHSDLRTLTKALSAYQGVQRADASFDVYEEDFGLSVVSTKELSLMKEAIKQKLEAKCEAGITTDELMKYNLSASDDRSYRVHPRTSVDQAGEEMETRCPFTASAACVDSTTLTDDYELGVTYLSLNLFNELYERQHQLRVKLSSQIPIPKSDASVATDLAVIVLPKEDFEKLQCQIELLTASLVKYESVRDTAEKHIHDDDVVIENRALDRSTKDVNEFGYNIHRNRSSGPRDTSTSPACLASARGSPPKRSSMKAITKDYVHSRVDYFENLNRNQMVYGECHARSPKEESLTCRPATVRGSNGEPLSDEELKHDGGLPACRMGSQGWKIHYLEELNERLANERNMLVGVLKGIFQKSENITMERLPSLDELLGSVSPVSEDFRREIASILNQFDAKNNFNI